MTNLLLRTPSIASGYAKKREVYPAQGGAPFQYQMNNIPAGNRRDGTKTARFPAILRPETPNLRIYGFWEASALREGGRSIDPRINFIPPGRGVRAKLVQ